MSDKVASQIEKGRRLLEYLDGELPESDSSPEEEPKLWEIRGFSSAEDARQAYLDERVMAAMGDAVLQTYNRATLGLDAEVPITKTGERYTQQAIAEELSDQYNLPEDLVEYVIAASKSALLERNDVE